MPKGLLALMDQAQGAINTEAIDAAAEGGAYLNNVKITDEDIVVRQADVLPGGYLLVRKGRRTLAVAHVRS